MMSGSHLAGGFPWRRTDSLLAVSPRSVRAHASVRASGGLHWVRLYFNLGIRALHLVSAPLDRVYSEGGTENP